VPSIDDKDSEAKMEPAFDLPPLACDCHMHIFGPRDVFPYDAGRIYTPPEASIDDYLALRERLGLERVVVVQPSVYGTDNRCHTDALTRIPGARGVAVIAGDEPDAELERLHRVGFRGARINLEQGSIDAPIETVLDRLGGRLREIGWHLQIFAKVDAIAAVEPILSRFPVPVMFDHFANLSPWLGPAQPGFDTVHGLLKTGSCSMKLSAAYHHPRREDKDGPEQARRFVAALIETVPDRLVWGSNWPHPNVHPKTTATAAPIAPFRMIDDVEMLGFFVDSVGDTATLRTILANNPGAFYDF
jgi:predicted TIM-barrel fold metal-dependent hydrolase